MKNLIVCLIFFSSNAYCFEVYQFIKWKNFTNGNGILISDPNQLQRYLSTQNIKPIDVVYHNRFLTNGIPDAEKIKIIADKASKYPNIPISFDIEVGDKFRPETVLPTVQKTLDLYHQFGGKAPVGLYGVLPQNMYGTEALNNKQIEKYKALNQTYETISSQVNFLSPVIYNLNFRNFETWKARVDFQINEAQKYATVHKLNVIPYFSMSYLIKHNNKQKIIDPLSEKEMSKRLQYIKSKNVNGIIIWDTNIGTLQNLQLPIFDSQTGAAKALINFSKPN